MSNLRPKWQNFGKRRWDDVRDAWLAHTPRFPSVGARPDPGLESLPTLLPALQELRAPERRARLQDIPGLREGMLWEAVFLFHKCSHTTLAVQRLGYQGQHSWGLFNAYHSAFLGAKGIMALLGIAVPNLAGNQVAIDVYPEPLSKKSSRSIVLPQFQEFLILGLPGLLEQRHLWEAFQRVLRMSEVNCWDMKLREELTDLSYEDFSRQRNRFLYKAHFWPLNDLTSDAPPTELQGLVGTELVPEEQGFLFRLSLCVFRLFDQLMTDLAQHSGVIQQQLVGARFPTGSDIPETRCYKGFLAGISAQASTDG